MGTGYDGIVSQAVNNNTINNSITMKPRFDIPYIGNITVTCYFFPCVIIHLSKYQGDQYLLVYC